MKRVDFKFLNTDSFQVFPYPAFNYTVFNSEITIAPDEYVGYVLIKEYTWCIYHLFRNIDI